MNAEASSGAGLGTGDARAERADRRLVIAAVAGLLVFAVLLFRESIFPQKPVYGMDSHRIFARAYEYNAEEMLAGRLPLWNPHWLMGVPHLADPQMAVLYPPAFVLFALFSAGAAAGLYMALHLAAAGGLMYLLARRLGLGRPGAVLAAVVFSCGGALLPRIYAGHMNYIASAAWMPLVVLLADSLARRGRLRTAIWLAVAVSAQFLAGHPQVVVLSSLAAAVFFGFRLWRESIAAGEASKGAFALRSRIGLAVGAAALAAGLSAVLLLPAAELASQSIRSGGLGYRHAASYSMHPENLMTLAAPGYFGSALGYWGRWLAWEVTPYFGVVPLALALLALVDGIRRPRTVMLGALAAAALLLAMGKYVGLYRVVYLVVPGMDAFRAPGRFLLVFALAAALLAGEGLGVLVAASEKTASLRRTLIAWGVLTAALAVWTVAAGLTDPKGEFWTERTERRFKRNVYLERQPAHFRSPWGRERMLSDARRASAWGLVAAAAALALLYSRYRDPSRTGAAAAAAVLAVAVTMVELLAAGAPYVRARELPEWPRHLREQLDTARGTRVVFDDGSYNFGLVLKHRLETPMGYHGMMPRNVAELFAKTIRMPPGTPLFMAPFWKHVSTHDLMGVKYVVLRDGTPYRPVHLREIIKTPPYTVYESLRVMPRAFIVHEAATIPDRGEALERVSSPGFDFEEIVVVDREPPAQPETPDLSESAPMVEHSSERVTAEIYMETRGFLVLADTFFPGWRATVDGREAPIYRADHALRGVYLETGLHKVVFEYRPRPLVTGMWISVAALVLTISGLIVLAVRGRGERGGRGGRGGRLTGASAAPPTGGPVSG